MASGAQLSQLWSKFYDEAVGVADCGASPSAGSSTSPDLQHKKKVVATLDGLVKILFGLDTGNKAAVVSHGDGALELIVALTRSADVLPQRQNQGTRDDNNIESQVLMSSFKAIKACLVRNPVGRSRVRAAGVFDLINEALTNNNSAVLIEEILTSLAAACLGDDLNALQASVQLRGHVDRAASLADGSAEGLKQKTSYLRALFDAVTKEQKEFIEVISVSQRDFFSDVKIAELELRNGNKAVGEEKFEVALSHYDRAMDCIETKNFLSATKLLNSLCCHVCWNRANVRFKLGQSEEALSDIDVLLQNEVPADIAGCAQKLRANALRALGRDQEAQEAAGKALVINPGDKELRERMANHKLE